ncbi:RteC domain-containing protein [Empedobacter sp. UBA5987]|uniref:RteC domain-containing protein n=1 Tax=Empedobacter sp. UBA5987 TaxID=1946444 RepID=UPI0025B8F48B|nr:RteC domain-containing protein [Empedobacter sp. UBA5987]
MNQLFTSKFSEFESNLTELKKQYLSVQEESIKASKFIIEYLDFLDAELVNYQFQSKKNEIDFFKNKLSKVYQNLFYYKTILSIENDCKFQFLTKEKEIEYYINCSKKLTKIHQDELELIKLIQSNMNFMDKKFFLRKNAKWRTTNLNYIFHNTNTFNSVSYIIGKCKALELIVKYIDDKIQQLKHPNNTKIINKESKLKWTAAKVLLIELIYGLFLLGVINDGKIEMFELVHHFEEFFDIDLKHHRSILQDIRERKINKTKFIDQLRNVLIKL